MSFVLIRSKFLSLKFTNLGYVRKNFRNALQLHEPQPQLCCFERVNRNAYFNKYFLWKILHPTLSFFLKPFLAYCAPLIEYAPTVKTRLNSHSVPCCQYVVSFKRRSKRNLKNINEANELVKTRLWAWKPQLQKSDF